MTNPFAPPALNLNIAGLMDPIIAAMKERQQREQWGTLGDALTSGKVDYNTAAATMFKSGQPSLALKLLELGQTYRKQQLGEQAGADFSNALGGMIGGRGGAAPNSTTAGPRAERFDPASIPSFVAAAGQEHGISPDFMQRTAWIESRGNPRARNPSGASGLFQFMPQTAAQYGLEDPFDPKASASAAARLASDNRRSLMSALRREPTDAELYLAHQQGAGGASALLRNPNASAHEVLTQVYGDPRKAAAAIKQNGGTLNMSAGEFAGLWTGKFDALGPTNAGAPARAPGVARTAAMTLPAEAAGGSNWFDDRAGPQPFASTGSVGADTGAVPRAMSRNPNPNQPPVLTPDGRAGQATGTAALPVSPADVPASGAMPAQGFMVPPGAGDAALEQRAQAAVEAANKGSTGPRIAALTKVLANPHLPDSQRQVGLTFLRDAIDQAKVPDGVKEFLWARGNGLTEARTPAEYKREEKGPITLSPGQTVYDPTSNSARYTAPPSKDQGMDAEGKLRAELTKQLGTFPDVQDAYGRVISAVQQREANPGAISPASDISLVFGFMKMLDPTSVVREGEYATAKNAAGIPEVVRNTYNKAVNGEFLTPAQRQDMVESAGRLYATARQQAEGVAERYRGLARQYGADPERSVYLPPALQAPTVGPSRGVQGQPQRQGEPIRVQSPADARKLPSGTPIILPDGSPGRVP